MKIRHPVLLRALGFAIAVLVRLWIGTVRYRYRPMGANMDPNGRNLRGRYIYAFWHENLLMPAYHYSRPNIWVLISQHADGELISEACRRLGFQTVRGSTTRGGATALRELLHVSARGHLGVTPDGPRGPRRQVQMGLIYLAAKTGLPIVSVGYGFDGAWRMNSWDRFAVPWPWGRVTCVTAEPIAIPEKVDKRQMEVYRQQVQDALDRATEAAERLAGVKAPPPPAVRELAA
jgi:lysophospholipid acyltransferase (LPLAT)-like uncharacterized protein